MFKKLKSYSLIFKLLLSKPCSFQCTVRNKSIQQTHFIVKQSSNSANDPFTAYRTRAFMKEAFFYQTLAPLPNEQLLNVGQEKLKTPKLYFAECKENRELLIFENVEKLGFRLPTIRPLDEAHVTLILSEVAKLHGASMHLKKLYPDLETKYPLLKESFTLGEEYRSQMQLVCNILGSNYTHILFYIRYSVYHSFHSTK